MTLFPARLALLAGAAIAVLALAGTGAAEAAGPGGSLLPGTAVREDALTLLSARDRSARADAIVAGLKRALTPGHLVDPLPAGGSTSVLDGLRADYSDMQRRAAGFRATLGDRHPTLATATLVLAELKVEIAQETRRILGAAERDAAQAHAALDLVEPAAATRVRPVKDVTGSIASAVPPPAATLQPPGAGTAAPSSDTSAPDEQAQDEQGQGAQVQGAQVQGAQRQDAQLEAEPAPDASASAGLVGRAAASGGILLAVTAALWGAVSRGRRIPGSAPRRAAPSTRREPGWVIPAVDDGLPAAPEPATRGAGPEPVTPPPAAVPEPAQATLPVTGRGTPRDVAAAMAQAPDGALARDAARLLATLDAAHGGAGRMTVLVVRAEGVAAEQGDGAALALAIAASACGRRVALLEARPAGRLRRSTVPAGTTPMVIAAGGTTRTAYRFADGGAVMVVLPGDAGEAEAAAEAARRDGTLRLDGLDGFDLVVMVGERAAALSRAADFVLVLAGPDSDAEAIAAVAEPCRATGRICRIVTLQPAPVASGQRIPQPGPLRAMTPRPALAAVDATAPPALRGTFDAEPERLVA